MGENSATDYLMLMRASVCFSNLDIFPDEQPEDFLQNTLHNRRITDFHEKEESNNIGNIKLI